MARTLLISNTTKSVLILSKITKILILMQMFCKEIKEGIYVIKKKLLVDDYHDGTIVSNIPN